MIAPSILSSDFTKLGKQIKEVENAGADIIHLDIMDGHFVPQITFGTPIIKSIRNITKIPLDAHLMVTNPDSTIEQLIDTGVNMISFHIETTYTPYRTISEIKKANIKAGIALNPITPISLIEEALPSIDYVLIMSVSPGYGGQSFIKSIPQKIERLKKIIKKHNLNVLIEVDGGIKSQQIKVLKKAGTDIFVVGSYIFKDPNPGDKVKKLKEFLK